MPLMHTRRTQGHSQRNGPDAGRADEGPVRDGIDTDSSALLGLLVSRLVPGGLTDAGRPRVLVKVRPGAQAGLCVCSAVPSPALQRRADRAMGQAASWWAHVQLTTL
ncbi:hypothetical protein KUCAC02_021839, partial [Chaenocephalus aceratus]